MGTVVLLGPLYKIIDFTVITPHCFTEVETFPLLFSKGFNFFFSIERNGKLKLVFDLPPG